MSNITRRAALKYLAVPWLAATFGKAHSAGYPTRPIRLIVGFAPGGGTDQLGRVVAQALSETLKQSVVVENRPGANMIIASEAVAKSAPDGYTLGMAAVPSVTNPSLHSKLPFDTSQDFTWISQLSSTSLVLLANKDLPANTLAEVLELAKRGEKLNYGSSGPGGSIHLSAVLLEKMSGVKMVHVPYKGIAPAMTDLIAGRVSLMFADTAMVPYVKDGRVKAIAVSTANRSPALPDVPTIAESGLRGYDVPIWYGLCGPAGMPEDIVETIARASRDIMHSTAVKEKIAIWGQQPVGSSPEEFQKFVAMEMAKWEETVKGANIKLD
jgi:tripartite-type tricarboxylate transporter receptor subunit TctC